MSALGTWAQLRRLAHPPSSLRVAPPPGAPCIKVCLGAPSLTRVTHGGVRGRPARLAQPTGRVAEEGAGSRSATEMSAAPSQTAKAAQLLLPLLLLLSACLPVRLPASPGLAWRGHSSSTSALLTG